MNKVKQKVFTIKVFELDNGEYGYALSGNNAPLVLGSFSAETKQSRYLKEILEERIHLLDELIYPKGGVTK